MLVAMECNRDEAIRAKEMAEQKMVRNDYEGAQKVGLKARELFPGLDNISQLIAVCDVHCSAERTIAGGVKDFYRILQVEALADEGSIRKQYRRLALLLHPDKNKFPGAEAAFKIIGEANMVLSDRGKRLAYDMKCREATRTCVTKIQNPKGKQTSKACQGRSENVLRSQFNGSNQARQSTSNGNVMYTFWTYCPFCNIKYEYHREYVNKALQCRNCLKLFVAYDIGAQGGGVGSGFVNEKMHSENFGSKPVLQPKKAGKQENFKVNIQRDGQFSVNFAHQKTETSAAGLRNNMKQEGATKPKVNVQKPMETGKVNVKKPAVTGSVKDMLKKRGRQNGSESHENLGSKPVHQPKKSAKQENFNVNIQRDGHFFAKFAHKKTEVSAGLRNNMKQEGATKPTLNAQKPVETGKVNVQKPMETGTVNVQKPTETGTGKDMLKKRGRENGSESHENEAAGDEDSGDIGGNSVIRRKSSRKKQHVSYGEDGEDEFSSPEVSKPWKSSDDVEDMQQEHAPGFEDASDVSTPNGKHKVKGDEAVTPDDHSESDLETEFVDCLDQDFTNFDKDKEEHCFAVDQIWACYDSVDGMPRFYAHIRKIYTSEFKLRLTWLDAEPEDDHEIRWVEEGLPVACGKFVHGDTVETRDRLMFSHQIICNKIGGSKLSYIISPLKGEIWALYRDWDINWNINSEKEFKFDIVEILSVHDDCVSVAFFSKVKGFVSVFQRTIRAGVAEHVIPSNERFRFSHRIPSAKLTGTERADVPAGSFELDMASLPSDIGDDPYHNFNDINMASQSHEEKVKPATNLANTPKDGDGLEKDKLKLHQSPRGVKSPKQDNANPCPMPEVGSDKVNDGQISSSASGMQVSHDFRSDKQVCNFQIGQIWAFWERGKGIHQQRYAVIKQIEHQPFKLHASVLKLCNEPCSRYNACGLFTVSAGKPLTLKADLLSHIVKAEARGKKKFNIYPREHQMWALSHEDGECEIVEVVETDKVSIKVVSLTRVPGSNSVFKSQRTPDSPGKIVELNRFSRQIPAFLFTEGCFRGCWELDPAALIGLHLVEPNQG